MGEVKEMIIEAKNMRRATNIKNRQHLSNRHNQILFESFGEEISLIKLIAK